MRTTLALLALVALAVLVHLPNLPFGKVPQEDAGVFLYAGRAILEGGLPYRDVWDHKPPAIYYLDALGLALGGGSILGVWALQTLSHALGAVLSYLVLRRAFGTGAALAGTAIWLLASPRVFLFEGYFSNFVQLFLAPLQFVALAVFLAEERRGALTWRTLAAGLLAGVASLLTPAGLGLWLAMGVVLVATRLRRGTARALALRVGTLAAGTLVAPALATLLLLLAGIGADAFDQAVAFNAHYARASSLDGRLESLRDGLRLLASSGAAFVALAGILAALLWRSDPPPHSDARRLLGVALVAVPIELALGSSPGRSHGYYWLAALPTVGILASQVASLAERRLAPWLAARLAIGAPRLAALGLAALVVAVAVRPTILGARVATSRDDGVTLAAVRYLGQHTAPDDLVLVWGSRASVLVLGERRSPTRFLYQYAPLLTRGYWAASEHIAELEDVLQRRPPTLIVDASRDSAATPPLDPDAIPRHDTHDPLFRVSPEIADDLVRLATLIQARYERVGAIPGNGWPVWRLRSR